ncbi:MAG: PEP-CTERM sorting domain-containing protein [Isosphaeraceae bacterium]|nr:PEP-CTERM sorting domain-containing protein [Isosphaeraceae bacterium]
MKQWVLRSLGLLALTVAVSSPRPAAAGMVTFDLGTVINGATPSGSPPWLTVTFTDTGTNQVTLTMTNNMSASSGQFVDTWLFNLDSSLDPTKLSFTYVSGPQAQSIQTGADSFGNMNTPGFGSNSSGLMDIEFDFRSGPPLSRFNGGLTSTYTITYTAGTITANSFNVASAPPFDANGPYFSAAHVQGIPGNQSGVIGANAAVPEPSSMILIGIGLIALPAARRALRRQRPGTQEEA